jgi:hypothetical protein
MVGRVKKASKHKLDWALLAQRFPNHREVIYRKRHDAAYLIRLAKRLYKDTAWQVPTS